MVWGGVIYCSIRAQSATANPAEKKRCQHSGGRGHLVHWLLHCKKTGRESIFPTR